MKRFVLRVGAALFVLSASGWAAERAIAQVPPDQDEAAARAAAKEQFEAGVADYEAQRYADALVHFQEAYRIKPHPVVRLNIASCYDRLGKPVSAISHYERFLDESDPGAVQRAEVNEALRALRAKVGEVTLRIAPEGAAVSIDGGERRKAPIAEPVRLEAGPHVIEVAMSGYRTEKREIAIEGGQSSEVEIALERAQAEAAPVVAVKPTAAPAAAEAAQAPAKPQAAAPERTVPAEPPPAADSGERPFLPVAAWVSGGATAAMFLGALITGQLALSAESDFDESLETTQDIAGATPLERRAAYQDALEAADRADALAVASDIFLVAGVIGAGVTAYLVIDHYGDSERADAPSTALTVSPTRVALTGTF